MPIDTRRAQRSPQWRLVLDLPEDQAEALAQLCKRFGYEDATRKSDPHDGGKERDAMLDGICTLQRALRDLGFAPR